ncbi:MAG: FAD-dependent oxidoreductase, partial [Saprospiraceae bacterium]
MKRREFIIKSGLAGSSVLLASKPLTGFSSISTKPKTVIIIGAGLAGLAAGLKLKADGVHVTILESRNRIGGRVFSNKPAKANGKIIELGAEWVGQSHERIISLCKDFGLTLENNKFETDLILGGQYSKQSKWGFSPELNRFWEQKEDLWSKMTESQKKDLDKQDWWRYLNGLHVTDRDLMLRELMDSTDFGESIRHTSAHAAFAEYAESSEKNEMDLKIKGGNTLLAEKMAGDIGNENILLAHTVQH